MTESSITVTYERKLSDGNYGSEGVSLTWTGPDRGDGSYASMAELYIGVAGMLRRQVLELLAKSAASQVAHNARRELGATEARQAFVTATHEDVEDLPF